MIKVFIINRKKELQAKLRTRTKREKTIKMRTQISEIKNRKIEKIKEIKSLFFNTINTIDKLLSRLIKKEERRYK